MEKTNKYRNIEPNSTDTPTDRHVSFKGTCHLCGSTGEVFPSLDKTIPYPNDDIVLCAQCYTECLEYHKLVVRLTYAVVTPESAAEGDYAEQGYMDLHGHRYTEFDPELDIEFQSKWDLYHTFADMVDVCETAEHPLPDVGDLWRVWVTEVDPTHDRAYFERGEECRRSLHLVTGQLHVWRDVVKKLASR